MGRQPTSAAHTATRLRIGTRGSPLALAQAREVAALLPGAGLDGGVELKIIRTSGDIIADRPLAEAGGKGLFTKEIDEAQLNNDVDIAVHSMKDLPTAIPLGLVIACVLPREDPRDVLIGAVSIAALPAGGTIGTSSLRRGAQVRCQRPDVSIVSLRGNVQTRIRKVQEGAAHATLLALAGLKRLGLGQAGGTVLDVEAMLPAVAQGAIAIVCRAADTALLRALAALDHRPSARAVAAERGLLAALEGSCRTPIAALAEVSEGVLTLRGAVFAADGSRRIDTRRSGPEADAEVMGRDAGLELRAHAGPGFFAA